MKKESPPQPSKALVQTKEKHLPQLSSSQGNGLKRRSFLTLIGGALTTGFGAVETARLLGWDTALPFPAPPPTTTATHTTTSSIEREPSAIATAYSPTPIDTLPNDLSHVQSVDLPTWLQEGSQIVKTHLPMVTIILDDLGVDHYQTARIIDMDPAVTLAFLPYAQRLGEQSAIGKTKGHELLVHVPMEPCGHANPGPEALFTYLSPDEIRRRLEWGLNRFSGYVGINNHMGSRFTEDSVGMQLVMEQIKQRHLLFVDSKTTPKSLGVPLAKSAGIPWAERHIFIDNDHDVASIDRQLKSIEILAAKKGFAIGIGHPKPNTVNALSAWLPTLAHKGLALVSLTNVMRRHYQV